mmetsp:Transcript_22316/g.30684  ORF Transcript_22316/g.30684 Transcript_22316/m.30684 type:complete len:206 (-) Transcript_22316:68-685(-)
MKLFEKLEKFTRKSRRHPHYSHAHSAYTSSEKPKLPVLTNTFDEIKKIYLGMDKVALGASCGRGEVVSYNLLIKIARFLRSFQAEQDCAEFEEASYPISKSLLKLFSKWDPNIKDEEMKARSFFLSPKAGEEPSQKPTHNHAQYYLQQQKLAGSMESNVLLDSYRTLRSELERWEDEVDDDDPDLLRESAKRKKKVLKRYKLEDK